MADKPKGTKLELKRGAAFLAATHLRSQASAYSPRDLEHATTRERQDSLLQTAVILEAFALGGYKIVEAKP